MISISFSLTTSLIFLTSKIGLDCKKNNPIRARTVIKSAKRLDLKFVDSGKISFGVIFSTKDF